MERDDDEGERRDGGEEKKQKQRVRESQMRSGILYSQGTGCI